MFEEKGPRKQFAVETRVYWKMDGHIVHVEKFGGKLQYDKKKNLFTMHRVSRIVAISLVTIDRYL